MDLNSCHTGSETTSLWLDTVIDTENHGVNKHLGKVANVMSKWEGRISDELGLTCADVAAIKTKHPLELKLQTYACMLYMLYHRSEFYLFAGEKHC